MIVTRAGVNIHREKERMIDVTFLSNEYILQFFQTATLFYIDDKEIKAEPNSVIIHNINHPRKFRTLDYEMQNDYVCFYTDESDFDGIPFATPIPVKNPDFFHSTIKLIYNEAYSPGERSEQISEYLIKALLEKTKESYDLSCKRSSYVKQISDLVKIKNTIHAYPRENWTIEKMASECNLSPSRFYNVYKNQFGITPMSEVINARIDTAKRLLVTTDMSVKSISGYCGYNSVSHFISHFKKLTGSTPAKFKKHS